MKILISLQQSIYTNEGKWTTADSNIQMMAGLTRHLLKNTDWDIYWLMAPMYDFKDISQAYDVVFPKGTPELFRWHVIERPMPVDAFKCRIQWDDSFYSGIKSVLQNMDVVINNDPSLGYNWAFLRYINKYKYKIATCNYWMDCPMIGEEKVPTDISYDWRQIEGSYFSDVVPFTCQSTKDAFIENANIRFNSDIVKQIIDKSTIWDFGFDCNELNYSQFKVGNENNPVMKKIEECDKHVILFPNRLSPTNYTHHKEFIEAVNFLYQQRKDFVVIMANPSNKVKWHDLKRDVEPLYVIKEEPLTRAEYLALLTRTKYSTTNSIAVSLYLIERYGGCCFREYVEMNWKPVVPKVFEYKNILGDNYSYYINATKETGIDSTDLCKKLDLALDDGSRLDTKINHKSCYCESGKQALEDILKVTK